MKASIESKFKNAELLQQAIEGTSDPVTVFVEVDLPTRQLESTEPKYSGEKHMINRISDLTSEEVREIKKRTDKMQEYLRSVVETEPHWLQSARAFIVEATGEQLISIAEYPLTKAIHLNRALK